MTFCFSQEYFLNGGYPKYMSTTFPQETFLLKINWEKVYARSSIHYTQFEWEYQDETHENSI